MAILGYPEVVLGIQHPAHFNLIIEKWNAKKSMPTVKSQFASSKCMKASATSSMPVQA